MHDVCEVAAPEPSERIAFLRAHLRERYSQRLHDQRREVYARVLSETRDMAQNLRLARALAAFLREKDIILREEDLLAGHQQLYDFALPQGLDVPSDHVARPQGGGRPEEMPLLDWVRTGLRAGLFGTGWGGHVIAGYERVLQHGYGKLADMAQARVQQSTGEARTVAYAALLVCQAASDYILRYAVCAAQEAGRTQRDDYRASLLHISEACRWVATQPPRTFFEAVQLLWLTHEIITCEQGSGSLSLGPVDQYLYPYYVRDVAAGVTMLAEATDLIDALWLKLAELKNAYQNVMLGGCRAAGPAYNDLSYLCLRATAKMRFDQPLLTVRWHPSMPADFWAEVEGVIALGMGFPALFCDEVAIKAKRYAGVAPADAADYAVVGCVELAVPGKEFSQTEALRVNWAKVLELMLNGGVCRVTGERLGLHAPRDLAAIPSFEAFYAWYRDELSHAVDLGIRAQNVFDRDFPLHSPYPFLSATMEGCLDKGLDVTAGGTLYNLSSVNGCGMSNAVDALVAIKRVVFDERRVTLPQLAEALRVDYHGHEALREALLGGDKFGNDLDEPDRLMRELTDAFCRQVSSYRNPRGGGFQAGLYTVEWHSTGGRLTGATPDGRRAGMALASGMSPVQGADRAGPTALCRSLTRLDHCQLGNGMVLDCKFSPTLFADPSQRCAFRSLVETYFQLGGMEIQLNVVSRDTLLDAQAHPERHSELLVRVSGFSAYFVDLARITQDEIIARTEHAMV